MSDEYQIKDQSAIYFLRFKVVEWVATFTRWRYKEIFVENINYYINNKKLNVHVLCIMSNHVHAILSSRNDTLSDIVRDVKSYSSKQIERSIE